METIIIQIGNSDNKLSQRDWANFISVIRSLVGRHCGQVHFDGGPRFDSIYQNFCVIAEIYTRDKENITKDLSTVRKAFNQDSIAVTFGETLFV
jgi:hypothetical protein